jgi:DNA polymerase I
MLREIPEKLREVGIRDIIAIDTEYISRKGAMVEPICMVAKSLLGNAHDSTSSIWRVFFGGSTRQYPSCPLPLDPDVLYLSFAAPAEWSCFLALGWELPQTIIDLYAEEVLLCNGKKDEHGKRFNPSLLSTMAKYKLDAISHAEKESMRDLILSGGPWSMEQEARILEYCEEDVTAVEKLLPIMLPYLNVREALIRGSYTRAVAYTERNGIPIDDRTYRSLKQNWATIRNGLAEALESKHKYGVYVRDQKSGLMKWSEKGFGNLITRFGLADVWPKTEKGKFATADPDRGSDDAKVFKSMAQRCPQIEPLRVTRKTLTNLRSFELPVGKDGRCRTNPRPWASTTGRNQPGKGFIFGLPSWARNLIQPPKGRALAYVDLVSAEFGIAAALSKDANMTAAYRNCGVEDVYIALAKLVGAVPADATKSSHKVERALYKTALLASQYGQTAFGFSANAGISLQLAEIVHKNLRKAYPKYWLWIDREMIRASINTVMRTPLGWSIRVGRDTKDTLLMDFPMQGSCADILRVATILMLEEGVSLCAMVHDAVLIEDSIENIEKTVEVVKSCWRKASEVVLDGFTLDADAKIIKHPEVFREGVEMWRLLLQLNQEAEEGTQLRDDLPLFPLEPVSL